MIQALNYGYQHLPLSYRRNKDCRNILEAGYLQVLPQRSDLHRKQSLGAFALLEPRELRVLRRHEDMQVRELTGSPNNLLCAFWQRRDV